MILVTIMALFTAWTEPFQISFKSGPALLRWAQAARHFLTSGTVFVCLVLSGGPLGLQYVQAFRCNIHQAFDALNIPPGALSTAVAYTNVAFWLCAHRPYDNFWAFQEYVVTVVFLADLVMKFFVMYSDPDTGLQLTSLKSIAYHYVFR